MVNLSLTISRTKGRNSAIARVTVAPANPRQRSSSITPFPP
ncbi:MULTISPECIES: hypothetical protein [Oscillatoriales]|nr:MULTISPECIES: hypothetical protein [Oscillatoriales]